MQGGFGESRVRDLGELAGPEEEQPSNHAPPRRSSLDTVGSGLTPNAEPTSCAALLAAYLVPAEAPGEQP